MKRIKAWLPVLFLASLAGTYLDLYFIGKGLYAFPLRPMPTVFSINIAFALVGLPLVIWIFLFVCSDKSLLFKAIAIFAFSLLMAVLEKLAKALGFFVHDPSWKHSYSFYGYMMYFILFLAFFRWYEGKWGK